MTLVDGSGSPHVGKESGRLVSEILNVWQPFVDADCRNLMHVHNKSLNFALLEF